MDAQDNAKTVASRLSASPGGRRTDADSEKSPSRSTLLNLRSSLPQLGQDVAMDLDPPSRPAGAGDADAGEKSDSEAETIVLPGKDGYSPSKKRKAIKHEEHSEDDQIKRAQAVKSEREERGEKMDAGSGDREGSKTATAKRSETPSTTTAASTLGKRKRPKHGSHSNPTDSSHPGNSSGLSSVPTSPVATTRDHSPRSKPAPSDVDNSRSPSPTTSHSRPAARDKAKSVDRILGRRKRQDSASGDEHERRSASRTQRSPGVEHKTHTNDHSSKSRLEASSRKDARSISPQSRGHRRSISHQLPTKSASSHGLSHKKKRVPAPLKSTEYNSDESSASASSHPRTSRLRSLAPPTAGDSSISPAKMAPHKKFVNSSGQTLLALACQKGSLESARERLKDRPEDLNRSDNAHNSPLHMASLEGHYHVVKFLLEQKCTIDPVNDDKETPLHDAIDNGHVKIVRLLLEAGANPNKTNQKGDVPLDMVAQNEEHDNYEDGVADELRNAIREAKMKRNSPGIRRSPEDDTGDARSSHLKDSPRQSPAASSHDTKSATNSKYISARHYNVTKAEHLFSTGQDALQKAIVAGDIGNISTLLDRGDAKLKGNLEYVMLAVKGGHSASLSLLLAFGEYDIDPSPPSRATAVSTPMLAAIGRDDHLEIIRILLAQDSDRFNPTRRVDGQTYYEIARSRNGPRAREEETLLKQAYDAYAAKRPVKGQRHSAARQKEGRERDIKKSSVKDARPGTQVKGEKPTSPHSNGYGLLASPGDDGHSSKRGPGRPKKDNTDRQRRPKSQAERSDSEDSTSEDETEVQPKRRRKMISGKEKREADEREAEEERGSVTSNSPSANVKSKVGSTDTKRLKMKNSDGSKSLAGPKRSSTGEMTSERQPLEKDRIPHFQRDNSKDRLTAMRGDSPSKRRKIESDGAPGQRNSSSSPDLKHASLRKSPLHGDGSDTSKIKTKTSSATGKQSAASGEPSKHSKPIDKGASGRGSQLANQPLSKSAKEASTEHTDDKLSKTSLALDEESTQHKQARHEQEVEAERKRVLEEKELEAKRQKALEEKERAAREEAERSEKAKQERLAREAAEQEAAREAEAKRQQEEAEEKRRRQEEEAKATARAQEEQRIRYLEQEKAKQEAQERRRAAQLEKQQIEKARQEEEERLKRLAKLPLLLRWFDLCPDPKTPEIASLFRHIGGYRYDTIRPEVAGQPNGREQWMLNVHAALLLGEKDLQLSRYTAWERITLSEAAKIAVWKIKNGDFSLRDPRLSGFAKTFPANGDSPDAIVAHNKGLFLQLDLFFVKVSEFMFIVPNFPHLRGIEMLVKYLELHVGESRAPGRWKEDPEYDPNVPFVPQPKIYVNGELRGQKPQPMTNMTRERPPDDRRVPRRFGLTPVEPHEADYEDLARKQGLHHLLSSSNRNSIASNQNHQLDQTGGITPPSSTKTRSVNHESPRRDFEPDTLLHLSNGVAVGVEE